MQSMNIVITGGPGCGKTTALDLFQRELTSEVRIVPEAATLLFGHGLCREDDPCRLRALQVAIHRMQVALEGIFREFYPGRLLICDRGTLDGLAYWQGDEASYFEAIDSSFDCEMSRYAAVVFFQTAAIHGEGVTSNNPYRHEDSRAALDLDDRLRRVWERHPHFHFIPSERSFLKKITHGLKTITGVLEEVRQDGRAGGPPPAEP